jgi:vacuolar-type H+-ATPase subunit E/Vma4
MNPMMSMPFMGNMGQQPSAEQMAQMQRLALQNQQLQLKQMKQMIEQYAQSVDKALEQIEEQLGRLEKGETVELPAQAQVQTQAQAQALSRTRGWLVISVTMVGRRWTANLMEVGSLE